MLKTEFCNNFKRKCKNKFSFAHTVTQECSLSLRTEVVSIHTQEVDIINFA